MEFQELWSSPPLTMSCTKSSTNLGETYFRKVLYASLLASRLRSELTTYADCPVYLMEDF